MTRSLCGFTVRRYQNKTLFLKKRCMSELVPLLMVHSIREAGIEIYWNNLLKGGIFNHTYQNSMECLSACSAALNDLKTLVARRWPVFLHKLVVEAQATSTGRLHIGTEVATRQRLHFLYKRALLFLPTSFLLFTIFGWISKFLQDCRRVA